nr:hypothetical protein [Tanacetum cinerariifolium]
MSPGKPPECRWGKPLIYFQQYTKLAIPEFHDTLIQHMEFVKKSIDERAQHKRDRIDSKEQDTSSSSENDAHDDADIRPIYDEEPMAEVPIGKIFASSTTKDDNEPPNGSNEDITNLNECEQLLMSVQEYSTDEQAMTSDHNSSELGIHDHINEPSSSKLVLNVVPPANKTRVGITIPPSHNNAEVNM